MKNPNALDDITNCASVITVLNSSQYLPTAAVKSLRGIVQPRLEIFEKIFCIRGP
jgi:hypothetical protein